MCSWVSNLYSLLSPCSRRKRTYSAAPLLSLERGRERGERNDPPAAQRLQVVCTKRSLSNKERESVSTYSSLLCRGSVVRYTLYSTCDLPSSRERGGETSPLSSAAGPLAVLARRSGGRKPSEHRRHDDANTPRDKRPQHTPNSPSEIREGRLPLLQAFKENCAVFCML